MDVKNLGQFYAKLAIFDENRCKIAHFPTKIVILTFSVAWKYLTVKLIYWKT